MPRIARKKSQSGIYHVMLRGINRKSIFEDDEDRYKFIETLRQYKQKCGYSIFAYCLMDNHVHLVIKQGEDPLESAMKRIGVSYVYWYNWKYKRSGHLFQDRYKSEVIEDDTHLLEVIRYIHHNPLKANITTDTGSYPWSSYIEYVRHPKIVATNFVLEMFSDNEQKAMALFIEYMSESGQKGIDLEDKSRLTDEEASQLVKSILGTFVASQLQSMEKEIRDQILRRLKETRGLSIRQIARITGLTFNVVAKA